MNLSTISIILFTFFGLNLTSPTFYSYSTKTGNVSLFFDLTVGEMTASTSEAHSTIDIRTDAVIFNMKVESFAFSNPILEQQFKEVYMEVQKYPETTFAGKIRGSLDFNNPNPQKVIVDGILGMHGVTKPRSIPATFILSSDGRARVVSEFTVKASDHDINIPTSFFNSGKDEIVVKIKADYVKDK